MQVEGLQNTEREGYMDRLPAELRLRILYFLSESDVAPWAPIPMREPNVEEIFYHSYSKVHETSRAPLKQISLTSRTWRHLTIPILFRSLRFYTELLDDYHLQTFLRTVSSLDVHDVARTLTIYSFAAHGKQKVWSEEYFLAPWIMDNKVQRLWDEIFAHLSLERVIIWATPWNMSMLLSSRTSFGDSWNFQIPYQRVELCDSRPTTAQTPSPSTRRLEKHAKCLALTLSRARMDAHSRLMSRWREPLPLLNSSTTLLARRPWTSFSYHGGSHLNNYGTYHYFEKIPPCILTADLPLHYDVPSPTEILRSLDFITKSDGGLRMLKPTQHLTEFTYRAIFPHYAHMQEVVPILAQLSSLRTLRLQLAPDPSSAVLADLNLIGRGNLSLRDCWAEIERGYARILEVLISRYSVLALPYLENFISVDCSCIPELGAELATLVTRWAPEWTLIDTGTWVRRSTESQDQVYDRPGALKMPIHNMAEICEVFLNS